MRILCVDDHEVVREGIALIIDLQPDMKVVGSAASGEEAVALYRELQPDITLMDLELPGMNGIDAIRAIRSEYPDARVIVLTMHHDAENIYRALQAGATTYLLKATISKTLIGVLREVHAGGRPIPQEVAARLAERSTQRELTAREIGILELIANGSSNKQIAASLGISDDTVHAHLRNIFGKLEVTDRTAAVTTAVRRGIVRLR
jgi:two-component system, NarL family, response regulator